MRKASRGITPRTNETRLVVRLVRTDLGIHLDLFQRGRRPFHALIGTSNIGSRNGAPSFWSAI
jgi:hypothetical protein